MTKDGIAEQWEPLPVEPELAPIPAPGEEPTDQTQAEVEGTIPEIAEPEAGPMLETAEPDAGLLPPLEAGPADAGTPEAPLPAGPADAGILPIGPTLPPIANE